MHRLHAEPQSHLSSSQSAGSPAMLPPSGGLSALSPALARVFDDSARTVAAQVQACLADADALLALLPQQARAGSPDGYTRHLVYADPMARFSAMLLVWRPGQASPVHGHRTWCAYRVLQGTLYERHYRWDAAAQLARPSGGAMREAGAVFSVPAGLGHIHSLGHPRGATDRGDGASDDIAISLHLYGVEAAQIATGINLLVATG